MVIGLLSSEELARQLKSAEARRMDHNYDEDEGWDSMPRFITYDELDSLADVLVDTEDSLRIGLSQMGIDPSTMTKGDLVAIRQMLVKLGVRFVRGEGWIREET